jgi:site-specific recombinase XerD
MATDFAVSLRRFLTDHMAGLRGCSPNTISSYRDTFKLMICWFRDERHVPPERITLELIDVNMITAFLAWLRAERHNSPSTCNQRLARSARSTAGCKPRTQHGWRAAKTSLRSRRASTTSRRSST